jgi:autotransporter family porin
MQYPAWVTNPAAVRAPAAWELSVPNGSYVVTVSVGDEWSSDSTHRIRVEGQVAIAGFVPTSTTHFAEATRTVSVSDGRLTIDAIGGTNTKIDYVEVSTGPADVGGGGGGGDGPSSAKSVNTAPGTSLLTDGQAAARVRRSPWEPTPQNYTANHRVPTATELSAFRSSVGTGSRLPAYNDRITGNFTGTTDEIIQWAAWKWGLDEDIIRAAAVNESGWDQANAGDVVNGTPYSFGIMQVRRPDGQQYNGWQGTHPLSQQSTPFNIDFYGAVLRSGIDGYQTWMLSRWPTMNNADVWGWVGAWYSGQWHDAGAVNYINSAKQHLAVRRWQQAGF